LTGESGACRKGEFHGNRGILRKTIANFLKRISQRSCGENDDGSFIGLRGRAWQAEEQQPKSHAGSGDFFHASFPVDIRRVTRDRRPFRAA
jgi:hypothetical protein